MEQFDILRAASFVSNDDVIAARETIAEACDYRKSRAIDNETGLATPAARDWHNAARDCRDGTRDNALRVMLATGVSPRIFASAVRAGGDFNVYAVSKTFTCAEKLLSASPTWGLSSDEQTLLGTIKAVEAGAHNVKKALTIALNDHMSAVRGRPYTSGSTQSSSSMRALEAMGIVSRLGNVGAFSVTRPQMLLRLLGKEAVIPASEATAIPEAPASDAENAPAPRAKSKSKGKSKAKLEA